MSLAGSPSAGILRYAASKERMLGKMLANTKESASMAGSPEVSGSNYVSLHVWLKLHKLSESFAFGEGNQ